MIEDLPFGEKYKPEWRTPRMIFACLCHPIKFVRLLWANRKQNVPHKTLKIARIVWDYTRVTKHG